MSTTTTSTVTSPRPIRLAVRAIIIKNGRLLLVNAWPGKSSNLLCAPGGGAEVHQSLPQNLAREVFEETGLKVEVGQICMVNEFHDPSGDFHQVDIYFHTEIVSGEIDPNWQDVDQIVNEWHWVSPEEMERLKIKPDSLRDVAFGPRDAPTFYDALEPLVR